MLDESLRGLLHEASEASIDANLEINGSNIVFRDWCYNDNIDQFISEMFSTLQNFKTEESFFNNLVDRAIRI